MANEAATRQASNKAMINGRGDFMRGFLYDQVALVAV
jgi:hypothetical protein